MLDNLKDKGDSISSSALFWSLGKSFFSTEEELEEFKSFKQDIIDILEVKKLPYFSYDPNDLQEYSSKLSSFRSIIYETKRFLSDLNIERFTDMVFQCDSKNIIHVREILQTVYEDALPDDFENDDRIALEKLQEQIKNKLDEIDDENNKIFKFNVSLLIGDIKKYLYVENWED